MGIYDRDWYRESRRAHWFHDMNPVGKWMVVLFVGSLVALVVMNRTRRNVPRRAAGRAWDERRAPARDVSPIHVAAEAGDVAVVRALLADDPDEAHAFQGTESLNQPLHLAAWHNHRGVADLLIRNGAKLDAKGDGGFTPLHFAARYGSAEVADLLVKRGAALEIREERGLTALLLAARGREPECARVAALLLQQGAALDLHSAISLGKADTACKLLRDDPQLVRKTPTRDALLTDAVVMIRDKINRVEAGQVPPPDHAERILAEHRDLVEMLIAQGANVNACGIARTPPLCEAAQVEQPALAALLLEHGADVNADDGAGMTPLKLAGTRQAMVDLLRKHGAR